METIRIQRQAPIAIVRLNRPQARNAINFQMAEELSGALRQIESDAEIRALILTGSDGSFSAGADLPDLLAQESVSHAIDRMLSLHYIGGCSLYEVKIPVVCAINGVIAGGGLGFALQADITLAAKSARFLLPFVPKLGLTPDMGSTWYLPHMIGTARAKAVAMLGDKFNAEQAEQWGLIWRCVDDDQLMQEATQAALRLAASPRNAILKVRELMHSAGRHDVGEHRRLERESIVALAQSPQCQEGVSAFTEKRPVDFAQFDDWGLLKTGGASAGQCHHHQCTR